MRRILPRSRKLRRKYKMASERNAGFFIIHEEAIGSMTNVQRSRSSGIISFEVPVLQQEKTTNRNERFYDWDTLVEACQDPVVQELLKHNKFLCERGHPTDQSPERQRKIDPDNATCVIKDLTYKRPYVGSTRVETAATAKGRDLMGLILENGLIASFSMRGLGRMTQTPRGLHVKPLKVICWDEVMRPSVEDAYMGRINEEAKPPIPRSQAKTISINEEVFVDYVLSESKIAQEAVRRMEIDLTDPSCRTSVNEEGRITVNIEGIGLVIIPETDIEREIRRTLASRDRRD
jgi:hypothetical protein